MGGFIIQELALIVEKPSDEISLAEASQRGYLFSRELQERAHSELPLSALQEER